MNREEMKLVELESEQMLSAKFWKHEYVIDRVFLMRAGIDTLSKMVQVSMRYRAEEAKINSQLMQLESEKMAEMSKLIG